MKLFPVCTLLICMLQQAFGQLIETDDCIPIEDVRDTVLATAGNNGFNCGRGGCGDDPGNPGCCRFHTNLVRCDTDNEFKHQPCICNGRTRVPDPRPPPAPPVSVGPPVTFPTVAPTELAQNCLLEEGETNWFAIGGWEGCEVSADCDASSVRGPVGPNQVVCCVRGFCICKKVGADAESALCVP